MKRTWCDYNIHEINVILNIQNFFCTFPPPSACSWYLNKRLIFRQTNSMKELLLIKIKYPKAVHLKVMSTGRVRWGGGGGGSYLYDMK